MNPQGAEGNFSCCYAVQGARLQCKYQQHKFPGDPDIFAFDTELCSIVRAPHVCCARGVCSATGFFLQIRSVIVFTRGIVGVGCCCSCEEACSGAVPWEFVFISSSSLHISTSSSALQSETAISSIVMIKSPVYYNEKCPHDSRTWKHLYCEPFQMKHLASCIYQHHRFIPIVNSINLHCKRVQQEGRSSCKRCDTCLDSGASERFILLSCIAKSCRLATSHHKFLQFQGWGALYFTVIRFPAPSFVPTCGFASPLRSRRRCPHSGRSSGPGCRAGCLMHCKSIVSHSYKCITNFLSMRNAIGNADLASERRFVLMHVCNYYESDITFAQDMPLDFCTSAVRTSTSNSV